jgi:hypothetical protein
MASMLDKIRTEMAAAEAAIERLLDPSTFKFTEQINFVWSEELKGKNIKIKGSIA